jgi:4-amino-4-deoxy-L-arabinose transferase-like glycosyltransferase
VASASLGVLLGRHALIDPDEGRNAAIAWGMATSGDYLLPRLNGLPYLDKPALFFAAEGLAMRLLGASELAARLPSLLAAWATVALTAWFAGSLFGRRSAWIAGTACATAPLTLAMARTAIFDSTLSFFLVLALIAFYRAVEAADPAVGSRWSALAWAAMAGGVLTKGPVALAVPLLVAVPYALWRRRGRVVWHPAGWGLHLLLVLPWVLAVEARVPGFLRYALVTETWHRLTTNELQRTGPPWYFLPCLVVGCSPWIVLVAVGARARWRAAEEGAARHTFALIYLALWIALPLVFFSLSQSKRPQYILPLVPAVALLAAWVVGGRRPALGGLRAAALLWLLAGVALLAAAPRIGKLTDARVPAGAPGAAVLAGGWETAVLLGGVLAVCGALAWAAARPGGERRGGAAIAALSFPLMVLPLLTAPLVGRIAGTRSAKGLAARVEPRLTVATRLVGVETFSPSLAFYLGRPTQLSSATGDPLRSNYVLRSYARWVDDGTTLYPAGWWRQVLRSCSEPHVFLIEHGDFPARAILQEAGLTLLSEDRRLALLGPCRPRHRPYPTNNSAEPAKGLVR